MPIPIEMYIELCHHNQIVYPHLVITVFLYCVHTSTFDTSCNMLSKFPDLCVLKYQICYT